MSPELTPEERKKIYEEEKARMDAQEQIKREKQGDALGYIILLIPFVSAFLMYFWVGNMRLIQNPASTLHLLALGTILLTAILAAVEASQLGFGKGTKKESSPVAIFLGTLLLWIFIYPYYLYARSKKGMKNLIVGGIIVALIFAGVYGLLLNAINTQVNEIRDTLGISSPNRSTAVKYKDAMADLHSLCNALSAYIIDNSELPQYDTIDEFMNIDNFTSFYLTGPITKDPWGNRYKVKVYKSASGYHDGYLVGCAGKDGIFRGWDQKGTYPYGDLKKGEDVIFDLGAMVYGPDLSD